MGLLYADVHMYLSDRFLARTNISNVINEITISYEIFTQAVALTSDDVRPAGCLTSFFAISRRLYNKKIPSRPVKSMKSCEFQTHSSFIIFLWFRVLKFLKSYEIRLRFLKRVSG